ncbi:uncharacterized protein J4E79_000491 [Alternaria viburni]|uniref:uncharacterized protein n=1 Tax=Alternaria viburni TaxID=566460 RepID=UPI0020C444A6|nr:uncharacterized protein J4E79_000491 [Alternaria viburni]KAI4670210.1 hypothetical protein J4E79_000491 [Alternaria viburni]
MAEEPSRLASRQDLLVQQHFNAEKFDHFLPGAPHEGDFRAEALKPESRLGAFLHDMYSHRGKGMKITATEMITLTLLLLKSRKATKAEMFQRATELLHFQRGYFRTQEAMEAYSKQLIAAMEAYMLEENSRYEVKFPPESHNQLRTEPSISANIEDDTLWSAWASGVGAEMTEEEKDPEGEVRYDYDYGKPWDDWAEQASNEMNKHQCAGTGPEQIVYTLPPGMENDVFAEFYDTQIMHPNANLNTGPYQHAAPDFFSTLPAEIKKKIVRLVLLFSTKIRIQATIVPHEDWRPDHWLRELSHSEAMDLTVYKFSSLLKMPKLMLPSNAKNAQPHYYWTMEPPVTMLALLAVDKVMHEIAKPIFYSENYFEIKDNDSYPETAIEGHLIGGEQLAHRFLELMSRSEACDGTPRYGPCPLNLMRKVNVDMEIYYPETDARGGQKPWHFQRIINTLIAMPSLQKLVINVDMVYINALREYMQVDESVNLFIQPEVWPGWRKLPWAASAIPAENGEDGKSAAGLKVFIPENRKVQKWLQNLINMPDEAPAKIVHIVSEDWSTEECPSVLITQSLQKAEQRWRKACKDEKVMEEEDKSTEHGTDGTEEAEAVISVE